jgi:hypothetical protein
MEIILFWILKKSKNKKQKRSPHGNPRPLMGAGLTKSLLSFFPDQGFATLESSPVQTR